MPKKSCCSCSTFLSCFSCVSARKTTNASADALSSSAIATTNVDSPTVITEAEAGLKLHDTQTPLLNPDASISRPPAAPSSVEGTSPITAPKSCFDSTIAVGNTNAASPIIATQEAIVIKNDPQITPSNPHASTSHDPQEEASSSEIPTIVKQDDPRSVGNSSSSTIKTVSDDVDNILKDVAAVEGDNVKIDLEGLTKHISELLEHIKDKGKSSSLPKLVHRSYLPTSKTFSKLKEFLTETTNIFKDIIPGDAKTIVRGLLQGMGTAHLATTGLLVVANVLERFEDVSNNRDECLHLLKEMLFLAKVVKQIKERPQLHERMHDEVKDATELIVEGSMKCCSQMVSSQFSKFFSSSVNKKELGELAQQLDGKYKHIYIQMGIQIYDVSQYQKANLSRRYPEHAVGIEEAIREVIDLLEFGSEQNAVAVILHGFGGMGKTTLADAVFSLVNIKGWQYSMVQLFESIESPPKIIELQKLILKDLVGSENIPQIRKHEDGQRELSLVLEEKPAFIYIDNALSERELAQLLPEDTSKAKKVRFLITARDLNVRKTCPLKTTCKEYRMRGISSLEAANLLKMEMFDHMEEILHSYKVNRISHIIERCGGIPLMLKLVARALRVAEDEQEVDAVLDELEKLKGEDFGPDKIESYFFAYDKLPRECKDPFLDICFFFEGWDWDIVANIMGESELKMLERRALVTKDSNGVVSVHDVILTLGRRKSDGERFIFTSARQIKKKIDQEEEKQVQKIKGIWLTENKDLFPISATILDSMHKSLRILNLGNLTKIEGKCNKIFENLIFFQGAVPCLPFDTRDLKYLSYQPKDLNLQEIPRSLRHMEFDGRLHSHAFEISSTELNLFQYLRVLRLTRFSRLKKLGDLVKGLRELTLSYCQSIEELPSSISLLPFLRVLRMDYCSNFKHLPEDIGSLNSLQELNLQGCSSLEVLPDSFEKLSLLKSLDLSSCEKLSELPQGIGNLTSLVHLSFNKCSSLKNIPESIGGLKSSAFSMDMSCCSSLKEFPDLFAELGNLRELNLCGCSSLEKLPESFSQLECLVKLNLSKCISLERLSNEFHCLSSLEILDLSGCKKLKELPQDFHFLTSLQNLYLSGCEELEKLPQNFHCLPSLQHLYLCHCRIFLDETCMDNIVKMKTLQVMNIEGSSKLVSRWKQIQRRDNQSWSCAVYTGEDLSKEEKENILQKLLSELDCLLIDKRGEPFHICDLPPNTLSLVMFHSDPNEDFPCPLIEETMDDIQINFGIIYIGRHFNQLPGKVKDKILGYSREASAIRMMVVKLLLTLDADVRKSWLSTLEKNVRESWLERYNTEEPLCFKMEMIENEKDRKCHSSWKVLSNNEMEEFVLSNCGRYLKLKQLVETSQKSNIVLLRELFATPDEESNHIFQRICASNKDPRESSQPFACGVDILKEKTIFVEMRNVDDLCNDTGLLSMSEMYLRDKERHEFEIITIPIVEPSTPVDVLEQFSRKVPWLVFQNPWTITRAVKYFFVKQCDSERDNKWYPSIFWIIEPNGNISTYKPYVLLMLNIWGSKAYPFTREKIEELRKGEWTQWKSMSNLEFLFNHLESTVVDQVKRVMFQGKLICLYSGNEKEVTCAIRNALIELKESIHIIYTPQFDIERTGTLKFTDNIYKDYYVLETSEMQPLDMEGMSVLNLPKYETMKFWMRILHFKKEINEIDNDDNQLLGMKRVFQSFKLMNEDKDKDEDLNHVIHQYSGFLSGILSRDLEFLDVRNGFMTFMDEDGKMIAACRGEIMGWILKDNNRAKRSMQLLIKIVSKKEEKQMDRNSSAPDPRKNTTTTDTAMDQENVDVNPVTADTVVDQAENVDVNRLSEYTSELLGMEQLYQLLKFNKEGEKSSGPKATGHYWPSSRGFSMLRSFLSDGTDANWVKDIISLHSEVDEETVIKSLLEGIGEAHWAAAGLLMIADILERLETLYANRNESLMLLFLLDEMYRSAMYLKQFNETWSGSKKGIKDKLQKLIVCIVIAALLSCTGNDHSDLARRLFIASGYGSWMERRVWFPLKNWIPMGVTEVNEFRVDIFRAPKEVCDSMPAATTTEDEDEDEDGTGCSIS